MAVDNTLLIKQIRDQESVIAAFCAFTGMPLAVCDSETFNDQVWIFENEELLQAFAKSYTDEKLLLQGRKIMNKDLLNFLSTLNFLGINEVVWQNSTNAPIPIPLEELVNLPDYSKMKPEQRPLMNSGLQLTGMYFLQQAGRPVPNNEKPDLKDLEEEFSSNLVRSRYLVPITLKPGPGSVIDKMKQRKYELPVLKAKDGSMYQPLCSDQVEFRKFAGNKQMMAMTLPFTALEKALTNKDVKGFILNPAGFHAVLTRELLGTLPKRFPELAKQAVPSKT